jgi:hypothetical protein
MISALLGDEMSLRSDPSSRRQDYIREAKKAEDQSDHAFDIDSKESWLRIARGYYELARQSYLT